MKQGDPDALRLADRLTRSLIRVRCFETAPFDDALKVIVGEIVTGPAQQVVGGSVDDTGTARPAVTTLI
jgi:hypothetical protein